MKKLARMLLVIALLITQIPMTFAATNSFTDVTDSDWFSEPVAWAVEQNITAGTSETTFSPDLDCTRGQIVTFLWRAAGEPEPVQTTNPFTDVGEEDYFYNAVLWAVESNITAGISETEFGPANVCTREQAVTFMHRAKDKPAPEITTNPFSDVESTSYAYTAILWAVDSGITNGTTSTTFDPTSNCTRSQIVTFLYRGRTVTPPSTTYTVTFDTNGGSEIPDQEVNEGETIDTPETPTREGYEFDGWYTDIELTNEYDLSTPVDGPLTLYAKWNKEETAFELLVNKALNEGIYDEDEGVYELVLDTFTASDESSYYIGVEYDPSDSNLCGFTNIFTEEDQFYRSEIELLPDGIGPFESGILYVEGDDEENYTLVRGNVDPATFNSESYIELTFDEPFDQEEVLEALHTENIQFILNAIADIGFAETDFTLADLGFEAY